MQKNYRIFLRSIYFHQIPPKNNSRIPVIMQDIRLLLCVKLLFQIPSDDSGKVADVPDIGKILAEDPFFRGKILFFPANTPSTLTSRFLSLRTSVAVSEMAVLPRYG